jgi:predicted dienelactone hydrolase
MRALESLLLLADLMALLVLSVPRLRAKFWMRHSPVIALVVAAAQWLAEGPRWQMLPAYMSTVLFSLVWWLQNFASAGRPIERKRSHPIVAAVASGLGALGLAGAVALPLMAPVFRFAPPIGPYAIGTLTYHWIDAARSEVFVADPKARRQLMVQIWYPAQANASAPHAAYMPDADAVTAAFARIHDKPAFVFGHFKYVTTHARSSAPAAVDQPRYPVLLFLEGATGFRQMNTFQVEHLVSHGYIVVAIDQPGAAAAAVVFPDGHQAAGLSLAQLHATVSPSYMPGGADPLHKGALLPDGRSGRVLDNSSVIPYLAKDVVFALDRLGALNQADPNGILTGKLDLQRVGAFGVSLGGIVVGESCRIDPRLKACLVMDAPMSATVVEAGLQQPGMWITRDAAGMRLERQRAGGWPDAESEAHQTGMRAVYEGLSGDGYFVRVPGMFHSNLTDIASWTPLSRLLGLSGPIDEQRAHGIINAYSLAFFDRHLLSRPATLLDGAARQYPEVLFESRRP